MFNLFLLSERLSKKKCFGLFSEKLYHFKVPEKVKKAKNAQNFIAFKLKTGLAGENLFVSTASRICELRNLALDFLNSLVK